MNEFFDPESGSIHCPSCGNEYTHHRDTTVYTRPEGEDTKTVTTRVNSMAGASIELGGDQDNPSSRRGSVVLHFECESRCKFDLQFVQHKGMTFVYTVVVDAPHKDAGR